MLARRFLGCIFVLILLAVAGAIGFYLFGNRMLARLATPQGHYAAPKDAGPDYSNPGNWLARPGNGRTLSSWTPLQADGSPAPPPTLAPPLAATFYVHPTTYLATDRWNAPIALSGEPEARTRLFVESQASAFAGISEVWAPRYRQAAFGAFLLHSADANKALDLAYSDVLKAFDAFLAANPGRPIILAGHSQGSRHLLRLLRDRKQAIGGRLVAAYVAGWPVDSATDLPATALTACKAPDATVCVMSWQTFADPANPDLVLRAWEGQKGLTGGVHNRSNMVCTNPLTGGGGPASAAANRGTLVPDGSLTNARLVPGLVGAHCSGGFLIIDGKPPGMGPYVLPGNNYHVFDYALWWGSVRADAERRLASWKAQH